MFALGYLFTALGNLVDVLIQAYIIVIIVRALISWVNPDPYNPIVRFLYTVTDPVLYRLRRALPFLYTSGVDLSPIVIVVGIYFLQSFLVQSLYDLARTIRYAG